MRADTSPARSGWAPVSWLLLLLASILLGAIIAATTIVKPASTLTYDALSKLTAPAINERLLIVNIDDESINQIGRWPWRRDVHARALSRLTQSGVDAIIYDVLFTEPGDAAGDAQLAVAIKEAKRLVLPFAYEIPGRDGQPVSAKLPIDELIKAGALVGHSGADVDDDGISRRISLQSRVDGIRYPYVIPIGLEADVSGMPEAPLIAYAPRGKTPSVPFSAVLNGEIPDELLRGKIILVGATAAGLGDRFATPVSSEAALTSGVEVLANVASNIIDKRLITDTGLTGTLIMLVIAVSTLAISFLRLEPRVTVIVTIAVIVLMLTISLIALRAGLWIDPAPAVIALMLLFPAWGWQRLAVANRLIGRQLALLRDESGLFDRERPSGATDRVTHQLAALETGIERSIDLRRFVQSTFDSLPDTVMVIREGGAIAMANREARRLFVHYCGSVIPENAPTALNLLSTHINPESERFSQVWLAEPGESFDICFIDDRHYQVNVSQFRNIREESFRIIRLSDLTALRQAERQQRNALEFLSHDLRSPQSSIIGLIDGHPGEIDQTLAARVRSLASRTLQLAQAFVDISRVQAGSYRATCINLPDIMQEVADALWPDLKANGLRIVNRFSHEEALIYADHLLLFRAITNLLNNAIRFAPRSSDIKFTVRERPGPNGEMGWACMIDDHGPGVERNNQVRIFERFQSGSWASGGVGLGLSLVAAVAAEFGGYAKCVSRAGIGTRFVLWFPAAAPEEDENDFGDTALPL